MRQTDKPPADLSPRAASLWRMARQRGCRSVGRMLVVETALHSFDRAEAARAIVATDGLVSVSARSGLPRRHPALAVEAEARTAFLKLWTRLGLDVDDEVDG